MLHWTWWLLTLALQGKLYRALQPKLYATRNLCMHDFLKLHHLVNYNKTAYMILTATHSQNCNFDISINGVRIQQTDSIKYLGVIIDNKLSWKRQVSSLCRKLSQACGIVCKITHFADIKILRLIYYSLFHLHLQYCIIDWGRA